jgi:hypothetical protein
LQIKRCGGLRKQDEKLVLREHTYDRRVDALLALIKDMEKKRCSPARVWTEERVRLA